MKLYKVELTNTDYCQFFGAIFVAETKEDVLKQIVPEEEFHWKDEKEKIFFGEEQEVIISEINISEIKDTTLLLASNRGE